MSVVFRPSERTSERFPGRVTGDSLVLDTARQNTVQAGASRIPLCCFYPPGQILPALSVVGLLHRGPCEVSGNLDPQESDVVYLPYLLPVCDKRSVSCPPGSLAAHNENLSSLLRVSFSRLGYGRAYDLSLAVTPYNIWQAPNEITDVLLG